MSKRKSTSARRPRYLEPNRAEALSTALCVLAESTHLPCALCGTEAAVTDLIESREVGGLVHRACLSKYIEDNAAPEPAQKRVREPRRKWVPTRAAYRAKVRRVVVDVEDQSVREAVVLHCGETRRRVVPPSALALTAMIVTGEAITPVCRCSVELDGVCRHGMPSWLKVLGFIK